MRKSFLQNEARDERKKQRLVIILGIVLVLIMILSSVGFILDYANNGGSSQSITDYGLRFNPIQSNSASYWQTSIGNAQRQFVRLPSIVAYVPVDAQAEEALPLIPNLQALIIAVDPSGDFGQYSLGSASLLLSDLYSAKKQIVTALTQPTANITTLPIISCANQTYLESSNLSGRVPIIQIQEGNETKIFSQGNCLIAQGSDGEGIIAAVERLRYGMWGLNFNSTTSN